MHPSDNPLDVLQRRFALLEAKVEAQAERIAALEKALRAARAREYVEQSAGQVR